MHRLRARTVKQLTIAIIESVLIMENATTTTKHTIVHVIQDLLGQIVNTFIVTIMVVRMVQRVSM